MGFEMEIMDTLVRTIPSSYNVALAHVYFPDVKCGFVEKIVA